VFLTDNGPQQPRWNAGLRGLKGSVYEGGIRVPFVARWPGRVEAGRATAVPGAHIDLVPTVLDAFGLDAGPSPALDGRSLWPLWSGAVEGMPERLFFTQWHRGDVPEKGRACAIVGDRWKLAQAAGVPEGPPFEPRWELFDLDADPAEATDVAAENPDVVDRLRAAYDVWFDDVSSAGYEPPRISVGSDAEDPVVLTRQDWRGREPGGPLGPTGGWEIEVARPGAYRVTVVRDPTPAPADVALTIGEAIASGEFLAGEVQATLGPVALPAGAARLEARIVEGEKESGARYVRVERIDAAGPTP
jgi:hypothetical protein